MKSLFLQNEGARRGVVRILFTTLCSSYLLLQLLVLGLEHLLLLGVCRREIDVAHFHLFTFFTELSKLRKRENEIKGGRYFL